MFFRIFLVLLALGTIIAKPVNKDVFLIKQINVQKNTLTIRVNKRFKERYLKEDFFAEYDKDIDLEKFDYSILSMPFIMNIISAVWISGKTFYIQEMDRELFYSLERVKEVFKVMYPKTHWNGKLIPKKLISHEDKIKETAKSEKTAILFSGGVDSTATSLAHLDKKQLLITAWGHWDLPLNETSLWIDRKTRIEQYAREHTCEVSYIRSNYAEFLNWQHLSELTPEIPKWRLGAVEGLGWAGLTAPILLSKGYQTLRIASSHTWRYPYPSAASPFIDNNLFFCGLRTLHDQFHMTRMMKINLIGSLYKEHKITAPFLKICPLKKSYDDNCGVCRKCICSALCFYAQGYDPKPFGIDVEEKVIVDRVLQLLEPEELNHYTILLVKEIQQAIQERISAGERVSPDLEKILKVSMRSKKAFDTAKQNKLDWDVLIDLLPYNHQLDTTHRFF